MNLKVSAIVLADYVFQDKGTSKHILSGTFTNFSSPIFPVNLASCGVYVVVEGVNGPLQLNLYLADSAGKERHLAKWEIHKTTDDDFDVLEVSAQLNNLTFIEPGRHEFRVKYEEKPLGSRAILAIKR